MYRPSCTEQNRSRTNSRQDGPGSMPEDRPNESDRARSRPGTDSASQTPKAMNRPTHKIKPDRDRTIREGQGEPDQAPTVSPCPSRTHPIPLLFPSFPQGRKRRRKKGGTHATTLTIIQRNTKPRKIRPGDLTKNIAGSAPRTTLVADSSSRPMGPYAPNDAANVVHGRDKDSAGHSL
jgi:hypothetical protein